MTKFQSSTSALCAAAVLSAAVAVSPTKAYGQAITTRTYTTDADFDLGTLINVNHDSPNNNQLQLNRLSTPFPFVNIAASARGTAVRIHVDTGVILGEYRTAPEGMLRNPSRTTVDKFGNTWVTNRDESSVSGGVPKGSVVRIGLLIGGTRSDALGNPAPNGQFVKPPFKYNTCSDRDNDGLIRTSNGLANILAWSNAGGADTHGGVSTASDECIINFTRVNGTNTRTVAIDSNNDVWVGGLGNQAHEKLNGITGQPVPGTQFNIGCGGYGGLVDSRGVLWSARPLLRFVPSAVHPPAGTGFCFAFTRGDYGLARDPNTGNIWHSSLSTFGVGGPQLRLYELDGAGNVVNSYIQPFGAQGVAVDNNSHVWMAEIFGSRIWHLKPDPANPGKHVPAGIVTGLLGVTGVAVDSNGKIWAAEINGNRASRIDPALNGGIGAIDLSVSLGAGAGPYNYSDMTGFVAIGSPAPSGTWNIIHNSNVAGTKWGRVSWTDSTPAGTAVKVEVRSSDSLALLGGLPFVQVTKNQNFCSLNLSGQHLEVRTTLSKTESAADGPILFDLTVNGCDTTPPVISGLPAQGCTLWPPNHQMETVATVSAADSESGVVSFNVAVTSNEAQNGLGDGDAFPDMVVTGTGLQPRSIQLRAERSGLGTGRVYTIVATAVDGAGNTATRTASCTVPHSMGRN